MATFPTFEDFFGGLWKYKPFPWQVRLAEEICERGWPDLLDLPTGAGKTSALDIAIYCLAAQPQRMPRRTVLVVDRRIVVDQGAERTRKIIEAMRSEKTGPVKSVADALRDIWAGSREEDPFAMAVMRGGMPRDNDWARRPDQPVIGVSTVDQVGSRILFRGYGISPRSAPIHAGLLGNDTLILLDEVHLALPFADTIATIRRRFRPNVKDLPDRFRLVRMSATAGHPEPGSRIFSLQPEDREHPVLSQRLSASKVARLELVRVTGSDEAKKQEALSEKAVAAAITLQQQGSTVVGLVVNRVDTARAAYRLLRGKHGRALHEAVLITGRMRAIDRDAVLRELLPRIGPRQDRAQPDSPLIVVATQCIEAGADFDFDGLVTECASLDALRQRFGRLDRQGTRKRSDAVILGRSDTTSPKDSDPIYGLALSKTWQWLESVAKDGCVDFGIERLETTLDKGSEPWKDLVAPHEPAPVLLPAHLDAWAQTAPVPAFDPDISLWLHGCNRPSADVQVVWRSDVIIPEEVSADREILLNAIQQLSARRPSSLESISVPLVAAKRWLNREKAASIADVAAGDTESADDLQRLRSNGQPSKPVALRWKGDDSRFVTPQEIRPGDVLLVPCTFGGISAENFDPASCLPVTDVADVAQLRGRGIASLLLTAEALKPWQLSESLLPPPSAMEDERRADTRERIREWVRKWGQRPASSLCTDGEWADLTRALLSSRFAVHVNEQIIYVAASTGARRPAAKIHESTTEDDDSSFRRKEVTLAAHSAAVETFAKQFAESIGLSPELVHAVRLAGWFHDIGKVDHRFQRWLVGGSEVGAAMLDEPLAKSRLPAGSARERQTARRRAGYPRGYRHELLSLAMLEQSEQALDMAGDLRDLVLHLVASHHGWCRPFAPPDDDAEDLPVVLRHGAACLQASTRHQYALLSSGVADRYWHLVRRFGWWGLAWLEAILRLADHRASEDAEASQ